MRYYATRGAGKLTGVIGGDHSATIGSAFAHLELNPDLSVLYIDAHADLRDEYQRSAWGHSSGARRIAERCPVSLVGVRTLALEEKEHIEASGVPTFYWPPESEHYITEVIATLDPTSTSASTWTPLTQRRCRPWAPLNLEGCAGPS